jgi:HSP20 family protein
MNISKHQDQLNELAAFQHRLETCHPPSKVPRPGVQEESISMSVAEWSPLVDISEDDREYRIQVELPEVRREDISVTVEAGAISVSGERKFEKPEPARKYHRVERPYGTFGRSFALPGDARPAKVSAEFKEGVLTVHLMKDEKVEVPRVKVQIA